MRPSRARRLSGQRWAVDGYLLIGIFGFTDLCTLERALWGSVNRLPMVPTRRLLVRRSDLLSGTMWVEVVFSPTGRDGGTVSLYFFGYEASYRSFLGHGTRVPTMTTSWLVVSVFL